MQAFSSLKSAYSILLERLSKASASDQFTPSLQPASCTLTSNASRVVVEVC